jgi:hypothetical protein
MLRDRSGGAIHRAWAWRSLGSLDRYFGSACGSQESASPALDAFGRHDSSGRIRPSDASDAVRLLR